VFSTGELDEGTRLLLESVDVMSADRVADLGCGYGAIGIIAARLASAGWTTMVDTNAQAVALAQRNIVCNDVLNADAFVSDGLVAVRERRFDLVLSNPPLHVARGTVERLTREAYAQLTPHGRLAYHGRMLTPSLLALRRTDHVSGVALYGGGSRCRSLVVTMPRWCRRR